MLSLGRIALVAALVLLAGGSTANAKGFDWHGPFGPFPGHGHVPSHGHGAPGPIAGVGLSSLALAAGGYAIVAFRRREKSTV